MFRCAEFSVMATTAAYKPNMSHNLNIVSSILFTNTLLTGLRCCTYAGDEIAIVTTVPPPVTEITHHKGYDVPCLTGSCLGNIKCAS